VNLFASATYATKGFKYAMHKETGANNTIKDSTFKQAVNYVDLNINLRKKFMFGGEDEEQTNSFFAGTGPVISLLAGGKQEMTVNYFGSGLPATNGKDNKIASGNGPGKYKPMFLSWTFSAGVELNKFSVWINYAVPLGDYFQDGQKSVKHKIKSFGINMGYALYTHQHKEKEQKEKRVKHGVTIPEIAAVVDTLKDTDGDGVIDSHDKCPGNKGTAKYGGCPVPDTDGDGINDDNDKCITVAGTVANNGCPAYPDTVKSSKDTTVYLVYFEPGKNILHSEAYDVLKKVVAQLKSNSKLRVIFKGHTDNVGSEAANYNRSLLRATVCADYVTSFYISKYRVTILSLGNKMPVADLNDPLVQWKNRRVEICVFETK